MPTAQLSVYFFLQAAVILATCRLVGALGRRFGQPQVVGEMIAGVTLGPSLLGWLMPQAQAALFPPETLGTLYVFAQFGVGFYMFLVGTAEVALAGYHSDEILEASTLPRHYAGFSPAFRREAGSYGKDTRGIFRVHWFDKFEMFVYCDPADAEAEHERLLGYEKEFLTDLEIPFQVLDVAAGDLGLSAARKYDCYGWVPSQDRYREITSTSNCTEFQARRLNIRLRDENGPRPLATLNGTLCAMARSILMILENHQNADGSVNVPQVLRPYLGGREVFEVRK